MNCESQRSHHSDSSDSDHEHEARKKSNKPHSKINSAKQNNKMCVDKSNEFFTSTPADVDSDDVKHNFFKKNGCHY